ncbi:pyruvate kinase [Pelagophyceae sp. CCMP2097]|nr:pyruvate kinase [Pelagophyceae sp. CCMP2097]
MLRSLVTKRCFSAIGATRAVPLTKLVATIGPASEELAPLTKCVDAGMNIMRLNFSHATPEEFFLRTGNLQQIEGGEHVGIMLDTRGPEIRTGGLKVCKETANRKAKVLLAKGAKVTLTTDSAFDGAGDGSKMYVNFMALSAKVVPGTQVLIDDGLVTLTVESVNGADVSCVVENSNEIGERKGVNIPGVALGLPAMSEKDKLDIKFGLENGIDFVAASFVNTASGVEEIRTYIAECCAALPIAFPNGEVALIISKIESQQALDNLDEIIAASDGIMVARGDLGVEVPLISVSTWQKTIVEKCIHAGKPVVIATQMLESMQKNPRPTRAEVADVTNAVLESCDAVMLSGESANGDYPDASILTQAQICYNAEVWQKDQAFEDREMLSDYEALGAAAVAAQESIQAAAILVVDHSPYGEQTKALSRCRPDVAVHAMVLSPRVARQLALYRGVIATVVDKLPTSVDAHTLLVMSGLAEKGDKIVVVNNNSVSIL